MASENNIIEVVVFGGGCFWCTEAVFAMLKGVVSVTPGYAGGSAGSPQAAPTYEEVSTGTTGHAEVVRVEFDPVVISFRDLLTVFFASHDPSTPNRQGNDAGTQYRSVILYTGDTQKQEAERFIGELNASSEEGLPATTHDSAAQAGAPIVTEIKPLDKFYEAEEYHKDYYARNPKNRYCEVVINPKLKKVQEKFAELLNVKHA